MSDSIEMHIVFDGSVTDVRKVGVTFGTIGEAITPDDAAKSIVAITANDAVTEFEIEATDFGREVAKILESVTEAKVQVAA